MTDPVLLEEAVNHDRVRQAMRAMRTTAENLAAHYQDDFVESRRNRRPGDARPDHNMGFAMAQYRAQRLEDLADRDVPLFFGRLWLDSGESHHLGRRHVRDEADRSVPLVIDWRAPVAERFYRASPHERQGVLRRRRFGFRGSELTSLEDEDLRSGLDFTSATLDAEITRPRTGPMRDIVATIQPEQDALIRVGAQTSLCVQGAPGTGKTAVGLHRAAWLLYTYSGSLGRSGMLVVGPNEGFLGYIADVLPTLGETSVDQTTVGDLTGADTTRESNAEQREVLKHDARMIEVCRRAVWQHATSPTTDLIVTHGGVDWVLHAEQVRSLWDTALATARAWRTGRSSFEGSLANALRRHAEERTGRARDATWVRELRKQASFTQAVDAWWPRLTAKQVLRKLYQDRSFRDATCAALLDPAERDALHSVRPSRPSAADVLLVDEIQSHLGPLGSARTYGHVVLDEAQDLSPLQCRAVARRCPTGSMTVLGDLAQGTTPWAAGTWREQLEYLGRPDAELTELTAGYRVPAVIINLANRLLPHLGVDVPPARSARTDGTVDVRRGDDLAAAARRAAQRALAGPGTIGVIATEDVLDHLRPALPLDERIQPVPAHLAKGLEFDHVIVVEPAAFVGEQENRAAPAPHRIGLRHLYVAMTRAVSRLTVVHSRALPSQLESPRD